MPRLALGTVQFGLDYGVTSTGAAVPQTEVERILQLAADSDIQVLDTAAAYGNSEEVLGATLPQEHDFRIVTKLPPLDSLEEDGAPVERAEQRFKRSLERLRQDRVYALLLHRAADFNGEHGLRLYDKLNELKAQGLIEKLGVSIYEASEFEALPDEIAPDLVQLPINVFDQRPLRNGLLDELTSRGVEIHARSVFLQGVLLMRPNELPAHLSPANPLLTRFRHEASEHGLTPLAASLGFVRHIDAIDDILIGVHSQAHLQECLEAFETDCEFDFDAFASAQTELIDPRVWA